MPHHEISGSTTLVTGASRGFGRAIATALSEAGADVIGIATDQARLEEVHAELGDSFTPVAADATDPVTAGHLLDRYRPRIVVLNAGAAPLCRPLQPHTWETFSRNWEVDVRQAFHWIRETLLLPLDVGSTVIVMSSGAALRGSPLSGGYAGAKATVTFIASYAADESERGNLGIRFISVLPKLTPATEHGATGIAAYARYEGVDVSAFLDHHGPTLTTEQVGKNLLELATDPGYDRRGYVLTADGLSPLG